MQDKEYDALGRSMLRRAVQDEEQDKEPPAIVAIAKSKDIERVKTEIHERYGFWPTPEYCQDLIAFVEVIAAEMMS